MDGVWVEKQRFDILLMGRKEFRKAYEIDVNHAKFGYSQLVPGQRYLTREVRQSASGAVVRHKDRCMYLTREVRKSEAVLLCDTRIDVCISRERCKKVQQCCGATGASTSADA